MPVVDDDITHPGPSTGIAPVRTRIEGIGDGVSQYIGTTPGTGDFSTNATLSVVNELVLFADVSGKLGKRSTGSGIVLLSSGILGFTADNSNQWNTAYAARIPIGGATGQVLSKIDGTDYNTQWIAGGGGGATEVWSGPSAPTPMDNYLVWIDTDEPTVPFIGDARFVYTQVSPASSWSIVHNLGKFPSVSVVDSGQSVIIPDVVYVDNNNLTVAFGSATSGKAYLN